MLSVKLKQNKWLVLIAPLVFLWLALINHLHFDWDVDPQYSYGWVVPLLCAGMFYQRWIQWAKMHGAAGKRAPQKFVFEASIYIASALLLLPIWLMKEANPEWRVVHWVYSFVVIALTLTAIKLWGGAQMAKHFAFPILFFLVAVPWLKPIESLVIQSMSRMNAACSVECVGWFGIPAIQHGNTIEISTGMVGVDDACSGIRSFQSSIMISLFLGELYALNIGRRTVLVLASIGASMILNVFRTTLLTWVAATRGIPAISSWHDPAGITIAIGCLCILWLLAIIIKQKQPQPVSSSTLPPCKEEPPEDAVVMGRSFILAKRMAVFLIIWIVFVEVGTEAWYRSHETDEQELKKWTIQLPSGKAGFQSQALSEKVAKLLRYDEGKQAVWKDEDGSLWQLFYFRWLPGRSWVQLSSDHTPDVCLSATGRKLLSKSTDTVLINGLPMLFGTYKFSENDRILYVYHCVWTDKTKNQLVAKGGQTQFDRINSVLSGMRNPGQQVLEIAVNGFGEEDNVHDKIIQQLKNIIVVEGSSSGFETSSVTRTNAQIITPK